MCCEQLAMQKRLIVCHDTSADRGEGLGFGTNNNYMYLCMKFAKRKIFMSKYNHCAMIQYNREEELDKSPHLRKGNL